MRVLPGFLLWIICTSQAYAYPALVIAVHDGDTIRIRRHDSTIEKVRLASIDAPELKQPMGIAARSLTEQLTLGRNVDIAERGRDRYGRVVATVITPSGVNVNRELVRKGLAWWYADFDPKNSTMERLQDRARQKKIGIWSNCHSLAPWVYRRETGNFTPSQWSRKRLANQIGASFQ